MKSLVAEAVSDPTQIEADVKRQMKERVAAHEARNASRKVDPVTPASFLRHTEESPPPPTGVLRVRLGVRRRSARHGRWRRLRRTRPTAPSSPSSKSTTSPPRRTATRWISTPRFAVPPAVSRPFLARFAPLFRRLFALSGFLAPRRRERAKEGVKWAKFGGETAPRPRC